LKLNRDHSSLGADFHKQFSTEIATHLSIDPSRVTVLSTAPGSASTASLLEIASGDAGSGTVVSFTIAPPPSNPAVAAQQVGGTTSATSATNNFSNQLATPGSPLLTSPSMAGAVPTSLTTAPYTAPSSTAPAAQPQANPAAVAAFSSKQATTPATTPTPAATPSSDTNSVTLSYYVFGLIAFGSFLFGAVVAYVITRMCTSKTNKSEYD